MRGMCRNVCLCTETYVERGMASERIQQLIIDLKKRAQRNRIKQKDLAVMLEIKPQQLSD